MRKMLLPGLFACLLLTSSEGRGQEAYPNRPVQIVVTFPAGGSADFVARLLAERMTRTLKQQVVKESGLKSLTQLVTTAKASTRKLSYASTGTGSVPHLAGELMKQVTGIDLVHVPYTGGATAMADLLAGRVELLIADIPAYLPHIQSGAVVALAINSTERTSAAPNIPTAIEQGFTDIVADNWFGLLAPAGTPETVIATLNQAVVIALRDPSLKEDFARAGASPVPQSPAEFRAYIASEEVRWGDIIKRAKIQE